MCIVYIFMYFLAGTLPNMSERC